MKLIQGNTQYQRQPLEIKQEFRKTMYTLSDGVYGMFRFEPILDLESQKKYQTLLAAFKDFHNDVTRKERWD